MVEAEKKIQEFAQLEHTKKQEIAKNILLDLSKKGNTDAQKIFDRLSNMLNIPDELLESIFRDFQESMDKIKEKRQENSAVIYQNMQKHIKFIHQQEEEEKKNEDNPEKILDLL